MVKEIYIQNEKGAYTVLVDEIDYDSILGFTWYIINRTNLANYYSVYRRKKISLPNEKLRRVTEYLSQFIMMKYASKDSFMEMVIDHANRNTLDNRRCNLRLFTKSQNAINRGPTRKSKSGIKGVNWHKASSSWIAQICANDATDGKSIHLGCFEQIFDAGREYDQAAWKYFGNIAYFNYPNDLIRYPRDEEKYPSWKPLKEYEQYFV